MNSRTVIVVLVILVFSFSLMVWMRAGAGFPITQALPFLGGEASVLYTTAGVVMLIITVWGLRRLRRCGD